MNPRVKLLLAIGTMVATMLVAAGQTAAVEFAAAKSYTVGTTPSRVATGDVNGDGKLDLIVANTGSGNVSVLLGNGDGTFQAAVNFDAAMAAPQFVLTGDFNGDGKLDVAVFSPGDATNNLTGTVSVLLGNGDGTFQAGRTTNLTINTTQIGVADLNGDHRADLIVTEFNSAFSLSVLLGKGDGTFQAPTEVAADLSCAGGVAVTSCAVLAAADFNRDGNTDLALATQNGVQVLLGRGDGTFQSGATTAVAAGYPVGIVSVADINGDGTPDLVLTSAQYSCLAFNCRGSYRYSVLLAKGDGSFGTEQVFATGNSSRDEFGFGSTDEIEEIFAADVDGDGKLDLVDLHTVMSTPELVFPHTVTMEVRLGLADGTFATPIVFPDPGTITAVADLNRDKLADVVTIGKSNDVDVLLNDSPTGGADLGLVQTGARPEPAGVGQNLMYSAIVVNEGPANATGVVFTDTLPAGVTFVSATSTGGSCSTAGQTATCNVGALVKAASVQVTIVVTPTGVGTIDNTMKVLANEADGSATNNSAEQTSTVKAVYTLNVVKSGTGTGTVSAYRGFGSGINCGNVCTETYLAGTLVSMNENPDANSSFDSWSGACTGQGCSLTMDADKTVTAMFDLTPDFTVSATSSNLSMSWGGQTTDAVSFASVGGFSGAITVACSVSGGPSSPTCSISPGSVAVGSSATLTVTATNVSAGLPLTDGGRLGASVIYLPFATAGCLLGAGFDRKRARRWLLCAWVVTGAIFPVACGGGGGAKRVAQSYVVTVTGVSGTMTHQVQVNLRVGQ